MALTVETGVGVPNANSYQTLAGAALYHAGRGTIASWQAIVDAGSAEAALRDASLLIDTKFIWRGTILTSAQGMLLPREAFTDSHGRTWTSVQQVARAAEAVSMLAIQVQANPLGGREIQSESFPDYTVSYASGSGAGVSFPEVDALLGPLAESGSVSSAGGMRNVQLVRWS